MEEIDRWLRLINAWVWGAPLLFFLLGTGLYLTFLLRGVQFRYLGYAFQQVFAEQRKGAKGDINPFEALMTSLAGAIGTGSIVGISTAVTVGGLGSLFWMWITALLSMAVKYAESLLAVKYREMDQRSEMCGGPMYYIEKGLGWRWLAMVFAFLGVIAAFTTGNFVQSNSIAGAIEHVWHIEPWMCGLVVGVFTASVVIGGVKTIGHVTGVLVPLMATLYVGAALYILVINYHLIPQAFGLILESAWNGQAAVGGFLGSTMMSALQLGVARSAFSNEAGLGISSCAAAAAKTDSPGRQAMINMTGALISTVIVCTMTGLVIAVSGLIGKESLDGSVLNGAALAIAAFRQYILGGEHIVTIGLVLFAYTTILAWCFYGEKCFEYLFKEGSVSWYRLLFVLAVIPGAMLKLEIAWYLADISNGLMMIPNLVALLALSGVIAQETCLFLRVVAQEAQGQQV